LNFIKRLDKIVCKIQEIILGGSVIIAAVILIINVFARALGNSLSFAEELGQFALIFITFIGTSYAAREGRHIRMTGVTDLLPNKIKKAIMIFVSLLTGLIMFYLAFYAVNHIQKIHQLGIVSIALRVPLYLIYIAAPVGFFLAGIEYFLNVAKNIKEESVYVSRLKEDATELAVKEERHC